MHHSSANNSSKPCRPIPRRRAWVVGLGLTILTGALLPVSATAEIDDEYNLALQFYKQDRWDLAAERLQQFLAEAPANHEKVPLARLYLGQALIHQRQFKEARPVFRDFVAQHPQHGDIALAMYRVGECSYFLDDFRVAEPELASFLDKVSADHALAEWALQYLGETELQLGRPRDAVLAFERGLQNFAKGRLAEEMRFGLARAYEGSDRPADARKLYEQLAAASGRRAADAEFNLAARLFEDRQYQPAAERFAAIAEKYAAHRIVPLATLNAGYSHYHLGEFSQAIAQFTKVADDAKLGPAAEYWIGLSLKSLGKFAEAGAALLTLFQKNDQHPLAESILFHAADSRLGAKEYADAQRLFQEVFGRWPQGELADDALHLATEAAILAGDRTQAGELHRKFTEQFPQGGLKLPQELLWGRLLLVEGDHLAGEAEGNSAAAKQKYRAAATAFTNVLQQSAIAETKSLATLQLARAWDRLENPEQVLRTLQPLVERADTPTPSGDAALTAFVMQSTALLSLNRYGESIAAANAYLDRRASGPDAAEALANVSLAEAHQGRWTAAEEALARLQATGNQALADRISYEAAEIAYDASQWPVAEILYRHVVDKGAEGEFYRPALSGLAYSLHEEGRILNQEAEQATADGGNTAGTSQLAAAIRKFDEAAHRFSRLVEVSEQQRDPVIQSDALYMQGLSLKLANRRPLATKVFMDVVDRYSLPADVQPPNEARTKAAYNAYRSAKEAARAFQDLQQTESADAAYQAAYDQLKRQPAEQQAGIDALINEWALMHYNAEAFDRANELFAKLIAEEPDSKWVDDARMLLAESEYFAEKYGQARESFRQLVANRQTEDFVRERSLVLLMDIAARLEDWKDVAATATQLAGQFPQGSHRWEAEYQRGEAALRLGQSTEAVQIFGELMKQRENPELVAEEWFPWVWLRMAESQLRLKEYDRLAQTIDQFSRRFPDSALQYHLDDVQGRAYQKQARFAEARAAFSRVIKSPLGNGTETAAKAQLFIADTYLLEQDYQQAFEAYYRVLLYGFPELQAAAILQAGKCEELLKQWQGAAKSYRQLLEDFPESDYADEAGQRLKEIERRFPQTVGS